MPEWNSGGMEAGYPLALGNIALKSGATFAELPLPSGQRTWEGAFNTTIFETSGSVQPSNNVRYYSSYVGNVRANGFDLLDIMLMKKVKITERITAQLRAECYNALDSINLMGLNTSPTSTNFGRYTSVNGYARQYQFSAKVQF